VTIRAVPKRYRGTLFRSTLEADWAATFDHLEWHWEYEPVAVELPDGTQYRPDFFLPAQRVWAEVKGPHNERIKKPADLQRALYVEGEQWAWSSDLVVVLRPPGPGEAATWEGALPDQSIVVVHCPECQHYSFMDDDDALVLPAPHPNARRTEQVLDRARRQPLLAGRAPVHPYQRPEEGCLVAWFKVDDHLSMNPKVIAAGNSAMGLWVRGGSWCAANLTDGRLPAAMVQPLGGRTRDAQRLVEVGLWVKVDGGYQFKGWTDYQPTKVEVEAERAANRERQKEYRERRRNGGRNSVTPPVSNAATNSTPTRPDPTHIEEPPSPQGGKNGSRRSTNFDYDADEDFLAFWAAFPRKTAKPKAYQAWKAARKRGVFADIIIAAAKRYRDSPARKPDFTAHPATWLNGERYNDFDEVTSPPSSGGWWDN